jgi:hypothetical protein
MLLSDIFPASASVTGPVFSSRSVFFEKSICDCRTKIDQRFFRRIFESRSGLRSKKEFRDPFPESKTRSVFFGKIAERL